MTSASYSFKCTVKQTAGLRSADLWPPHLGGEQSREAWKEEEKGEVAAGEEGRVLAHKFFRILVNK